MRENSFSGDFIVIEGPDGAGSTTHSKKLAEELDGFYTNEPTQGKTGQKVKEMIEKDDHSAEAIALAFTADRMVHVEEEVLPALERGEKVVCDRYYHSTLVYESVMGADFDWLKDINRYVPEPDVTVVLDVSAEEGMSRIEKRGSDENIFENLSFQEKVVLSYRELQDRLDERIELVDASRPMDEVFEEVRDAVERFI